MRRTFFSGYLEHFIQGLWNLWRIHQSLFEKKTLQIYRHITFGVFIEPAFHLAFSCSLMRKWALKCSPRLFFFLAIYLPVELTQQSTCIPLQVCQRLSLSRLPLHCLEYFFIQSFRGGMATRATAGRHFFCIRFCWTCLQSQNSGCLGRFFTSFNLYLHTFSLKRTAPSDRCCTWIFYSLFNTWIMFGASWR